MNKYFNLNINVSAKAFTTLSFAFLMVFLAACKKDKQNGATYFELEENASNLEVPVEGISKTYQVKSDGLWMIDIADGGDWLKVTPLEGRGDGSFTVTVDKNRTSHQREAALIFRANFQRQDNLLKIKQEANENPPYFKIEGESAKFEVTGKGGSEVFMVSSNSSWKIEIPENVDWITVDPASGNGDGSFQVTVEPNPAYTTRSAQLSFIVDEQKHSLSFEVAQEGKVDETVILNEDFSWLTYGSAVFYTTTGETRMDNWSDEEMAKGWTSTVNTVSGSGNQPLVYARQGFVKLGKTSYGGDLITPKLSAINGTQNVVVSFKAVPYQTQGGARDGNILKVSVIGPGTVSMSQFTIDNWPDYSADPENTEIWKAPETTRTFTVTGATAETQIRFLGGDLDLRAPADPNKNRIFLDDIIVTVK